MAFTAADIGKAVLAERERCARIAEDIPNSDWADWDLKNAGHEIAKHIRGGQENLAGVALRINEKPVLMTNIQVP